MLVSETLIGTKISVPGPGFLRLRGWGVGGWGGSANLLF